MFRTTMVSEAMEGQCDFGERIFFIPKDSKVPIITEEYLLAYLKVLPAKMC